MSSRRQFLCDLGQLCNIITMIIMIMMIVPVASIALRVQAGDSKEGELSQFSDSYSDEMYHKLAEEYETGEMMSDLRKDALKRDDVKDPGINVEYLERLEVSQGKDEGGEATNNELGIRSETITTTTTTESYGEAIRRLQCDNPWFWNSFKCLWLDVRKRNFISRTRSNAITVAWILGPPMMIVLWFVCGFIIIAIFVRARIKQVQRKIEELRVTYEPGKITLFDGTVKQYPPTKEEIEAFEELISSLVSLV